MSADLQVSQEVLLGILDHFKRNKVQKLSHTDIVVGAIQGSVLQANIYFEKVFEVPFRPDSKDIDEEYLSTKLELEKMVNPELDLVGLYIRSQSLACEELVEKVYKVFQKKTELLFALVLDPYSAPNTDNQVPLSVFEWVSHDKKFRRVPSHVRANSSEIICANDLLKEVSGASLGGSGFVRGFKSWHGSFHNYQTKLQKLEQLLSSDTPLSQEHLRQAKEVVINYPSHFTDDHGTSLQAKFTTANTASLLAAVLKAQQTQNMLVGMLAEKQKASAK